MLSDDPLNLDKSRLPSHVAIIMDGNGRWAKQRLLNRVKGHEKGSEAVRKVVRACREIGIKVLTLYAFSTENWDRPEGEVKALMSLLKKFIKGEKKEMLENNVRLNAIGQIERLPRDVREVLAETMAATEKNDGLLLNLALSYGSRAEMTRMVARVSSLVKNGEIDSDEITPDLIARHLYTSGIPDPDLLIRTSGEMRISNFLLWQIAYAEIYFTPTLWPDFGKEEFVKILRDYQGRERRFGKVL